MTGNGAANGAPWIGGEPPEEARVLALLPPAPSEAAGVPWAGAACRIARSFARRHRRVLVLDLTGPESGLSASLGLPASPGLWQILQGEAKVREAAVPSAGHGFIYLPTGGPGGAGLWADAARGAGLRRLVERARSAGAAVLLLVPPGEPCPPDWLPLLDGSVELREVPAGPGPAGRPARVVGSFRSAPDRAGTRGRPPDEGSQQAAARRLIAAGKWEAVPPGPPPGPGHAGAPLAATGPGTAPPGVRRRRPRRPRPGRVPPAPPRRRPAGLAGVLLPLAFLTYCALLAVWWRVESPPVARDAEEVVASQGAAGLRSDGPPAPLLAPAAFALPTDSPRLSLPPPLPYSTFTVGSLLPEAATEGGEAGGPPEGRKEDPRTP